MQSSTVSNKHHKQAPHVPNPVGMFGGASGFYTGNIAAHTKPVGYASMELAEKKFYELLDLIKKQGSNMVFNVANGTTWENVGIFCSPDYLDNQLTVTYEMHYVHKDCWGNELESWTSTDSDRQTATHDNTVVSIHNRRGDFEADGWTVTGTYGDTGDMISEYPHIEVDVKDRSKSITYHLEKETKDTNCDRDCINWAPQEFVNSNTLEGHTRVRIGVRNLTLQNDYHQWHHDGNTETELIHGVIYAKPTDSVQWKYCYYPGVERTAHQIVTPAANANKHPEPSTMHPTVNELHNDEFYKIYGGWTGTFRAWSEHLKQGEDMSDSRSAELGDDTVLLGTIKGGPLEGNEHSGEVTDTDPNRRYGVQPRDQDRIWLRPFSEVSGKLDPGDILYGNIQVTSGWTNVYRSVDKVHTWNCNQYSCPTEKNPGRKCWETCKHDSIFYPNHGDKATQKDVARVIVPYNYRNHGGAEIKEPDEGYAFAGETIEVENPQITVDLRENKETDGDLVFGYATNVPTGQARLIAFLSDPKTVTEDKPFNWASGAAVTDDGFGNSINDLGEDVKEGTLWWGDEPRRAVASKNGVCKNLETITPAGGLNRNSSLNGVTYDMTEQTEVERGSINPDNKRTKTYNIFDEAAGNYFCVAAAVYPFSVQGDKEEGLIKNGDNAWYVSKPSCIKIAKRPTFQVWGAGIYTAGGVSLYSSLTEKTNVLDNYNNAIWDNFDEHRTTMDSEFVDWTPTGNQGTNNKVNYGSFVELDAIIEGSSTSSNFASGAALGYRGGGPTWAAYQNDNAPFEQGFPGGTLLNTTRCLRNPLTIANDSCADFTGSAETSLRQSIIDDVNALSNKFQELASAGESITFDTSGSIPGQTIPKGTTKVTIHPGTITITGDIVYQEGYRNIYDIPKYIIYARGGDINIACTVNRIDAVLITDSGSNVNTCGEGGATVSSPADDPANSHRLVINGAVVTGAMKLNRTFGANTGENSIVPAELINYDSTLYLWANRVASVGESGQLTETATQELAPRYQNRASKRLSIQKSLTVSTTLILVVDS